MLYSLSRRPIAAKIAMARKLAETRGAAAGRGYTPRVETLVGLAVFLGAMCFCAKAIDEERGLHVDAPGMRDGGEVREFDVRLRNQSLRNDLEGGDGENVTAVAAGAELRNASSEADSPRENDVSAEWINGMAPPMAKAIDGMYSGLDDGEANIAFFLQVSTNTMPLVERLLRRLWHQDNIFAIHLDAKVPDWDANRLIALVAADPKYTNVHFIEREPITYKGVTMLLNTLSAIEFLLQKNARWDYFINVSGADYPLVTVQHMRKLLGQPQLVGRNVSFLQLAPDKRFWSEMQHSRFDHIFYDTALGFRRDVEHRLVETWTPHPIAEELGLEFVQAEAWVTIHRSFCKFSTRSAFARRLLVLLSNMQDPEEHFFPMLAWNSPKHNETLAHHALRSIYWSFRGQKSGQHPFVVDERDENGSYPFWGERISKSPAFFLRKFRFPDSSLMDLIDKHKSGAHMDADVDSVAKSFSVVRSMLLCLGDVDRHRYMDRVVGCFKGGNLRKK